MNNWVLLAAIGKAISFWSARTIYCKNENDLEGLLECREELVRLLFNKHVHLSGFINDNFQVQAIKIKA